MKKNPFVLCALLIITISGAGIFVALTGNESTTISITSEPSHSGPSKAHYISVADEVCSNAHEESAPYLVKMNSLSPEAVKAGEEVATITTYEVEALRRWRPPSADQQTINKMLALVDSEINIFRELTTAIKYKDTEKIESLSAQIKPIEAEAQGIAQGYGFKVCGS